jgi:hypothetical protein
VCTLLFTNISISVIYHYVYINYSITFLLCNCVLYSTTSTYTYISIYICIYIHIYSSAALAGAYDSEYYLDVSSLVHPYQLPRINCGIFLGTIQAVKFFTNGSTDVIVSIGSRLSQEIKSKCLTKEFVGGANSCAKFAKEVPEILKFVHDQANNGKRVLIHCALEISRATIFLATYAYVHHVSPSCLCIFVSKLNQCIARWIKFYERRGSFFQDMFLCCTADPPEDADALSAHVGCLFANDFVNRRFTCQHIATLKWTLEKRYLDDKSWSEQWFNDIKELRKVCSIPFGMLVSSHIKQ